MKTFIFLSNIFFLLYISEGQSSPSSLTNPVWQMNTTHILPSVKSSQRCSFHKSPNVAMKQRIIDEIELKSKFIHHIDIFRCSAPPGKTFSETFDKYLTTDGFDCTDNENGISNEYIPSEYCTYYCFWTCPYPSPPNRYPSTVSHTFSGNQYMYMVVHMENPDLLENTQVTAGVDFPYEMNTREYDSGFLRVGRYVSYKNLIPPNSVDFTVPHKCGSDCTKRLKEDMNIFGITFHAHESAKQVRLIQLRNGQEIRTIAHDVQYSPMEPFKFKKLQNEVKFLPGDEFQVECSYDTTWKKGEVIIGGNTLESEMCIAFIEYYPRSLDVSQCGNTLAESEMFQFFGIEEMELENIVNPKVISPAKFHGMTFTDVVQNFDWSQEKRDHFQELMLHGDKDSYCIPE